MISKQRKEIAMKAIVLNKIQVDSILNGATTFIMMIDDQSKDNITNIKFVLNPVNGKIVFKPLLACVPLQIGQKFFVQEDFIEGYNDIEEKDFTKVWYKSDDDLEEWYFSEDEATTEIPWDSASEMTYNQSRLRDMVTATVEVKRVQDINGWERDELLGKANTPIMDFNNLLKNEEAIDSEHELGTYESNPYCFVCTFEKNN